MRAEDFRCPRPGRRARAIAIFACWLGLAVACGPDNEPFDRCHKAPTFLVTIVPEEGSLPDDTRVSFEYGGGIETYELRTPRTPQVAFCEPRSSPSETTQDSGEGGAGADIGGGAGSGGEMGTMPITQIVCKLWTGGATDVDVTASGFEPVVEYPLQIDRDLCTVTKTITLDLIKDSHAKSKDR